MNSKVNIETSLLFPTVVSKVEHGDRPENQYFYDLVSKMKLDKSIANKCEAADTTTFMGYQPDIVLHEYLENDPMWQSFMNQCFHPAIQAHMQKHQMIAGFPVPGSTYVIHSSWAVIYPANSYQAPHFHRDTSCVFTYYVKVPKRPSPEAAITFINPNLASTYPKLKSFAYDHTIQPKNGSNVIFPGSMQHYAHPHFGDEEKMIIVFDIGFEPPSGYQRQKNRY
ncbi:hypothetical protein FLL45_10990 [Aliikangiella marina]|uniref:Phytanoyl-CoA dioxygenase family protein n=1 Tax=Aliikangiella marina TaxID=1712262 RepID=A0A545TDZ1_9GAMM|nr:putative 2OG-Fe(II) oxygenase [Aliikangiella marina]TQV75439.1 hypothetical protein FLL45_10990 [Aliikangiella marina]